MNEIKNKTKYCWKKHTTKYYMGSYSKGGYTVYSFHDWTIKNNRRTGPQTDYYFKITNFRQTYLRLLRLQNVMNKIDDGFTAVSIHGYATGIPQVDSVIAIIGTVYSASNAWLLQPLVKYYIRVYQNKKDYQRLEKFINYNWLSEVILNESTKYF